MADCLLHEENIDRPTGSSHATRHRPAVVRLDMAGAIADRCRLAVLHGRREDFDKLTLLCDKMESSLHDTLEFSAADTEFHHTLVKCTRNVLLIWIIDQINSVRGQTDWKRMRGLTLNPTVIDQYNKQHRKILEALYRREPEAAANSMKEHLETVRLSLTRAAAA